MRKHVSPEEKARGARFKTAAKANRFTSARIGELVGAEDGSIRGYWSGEHVPSADKLQRYAEVTGYSVEWLLYGPPAEAQPGRLVEWVIAFADRVAAGDDPAAAIEAAAGQPAAISDQVRARLAQGSDAMRRSIEEMAGRPWNELTQDERRRLALRLVELAEE